MIVPLAGHDLSDLLAAALDLPEDAAETGAVLDRLLAQPPERRTVRLVWADADPPDADPAEANPALGVVFASTRDDDPAVAHLDLLAVAPAARQRGIARALVTAAEEALRGYGVHEVRIAGNDPCYAWPGIDVRYTPAVCAATALGYEQTRTAWNMTADLTGPIDPTAAEARVAGAGITVRRATPDDTGRVEAFAREHFSGGWWWELRESIARDAAGAVAGCHLGLRDGELLGFAAYGALRPSLFGPMGTAPAARGTGIGEVLLRRCLRDQRDAGLATAEIGWAGPIAFYSRTVGARIGRVFVLYRKAL